MSSRSVQRTSVLAATAALGTVLALTAATPSSATPAPDQRAGSAQAQAEVASADADVRRAERATRAARQLGDRQAGVYYDAETEQMVVNVTRRSAADRMAARGMAARVVDHGIAELTAVTRTLGERVSTPGTAWSIDPAADEVVVTLDSTVSTKAADKVDRITAKYGDKVRVERIAGQLQPTVSGGQAIYGGGSRCSLGFNVRSGSSYYFLTAGHCTNLSSSWYSNSSQTSMLGTRAGTSFPGNDYGIVRYSTSAGAGNVYLYNGAYQDITTSGNAYVGQAVTRSGSTTGVHTGVVQALNATVNYPEGTVSGLIKTNVCAEGGDSGGSLFAGSTALGLTSGGNGNCTLGGTTYFQPVTEALGVYGVSVY